MRSNFPILVLLAALVLLAGCKKGADEFFSGRPSEMAMVHNRVIGGPPEAMLELLRVPSRFPEATDAHIADWQESAIAWWHHPEKRGLMAASFGTLSREERHALRNWVRVRDQHRSKEKAKVLDEVEVAINQAADA